MTQSQEDSAIRHGETDAIERAGRLPASVYRECTLHTTLSSCIMRAGTSLLYGIPRIVIGENRSFTGAEAAPADRGVDLVVADHPRCLALTARMLEERLDLWNEDIGE